MQLLIVEDGEGGSGDVVTEDQKGIMKELEKSCGDRVVSRLEVK